MAWEIIEGPVDARAEIPEGEGRGDFDGDVYRLEVERDGGERKEVFVRFRGTPTAVIPSPHPREDHVEIARKEVERRLKHDSIPRCITFAGGAEPLEDDDCPRPWSEP